MEHKFEPQDITRVLYQAVSGPAGPRSWGRAAAFFHPSARLVRTGVDPDTGPFQMVMTWEEFAANVDRRLADLDFYEEEIDQRCSRYGHVAEVRSLYRFRFDDPTNQRTGFGLNLFNFVMFPDGWKIMSLVWDNERPGLAPPLLD